MVFVVLALIFVVVVVMFCWPTPKAKQLYLLFLTLVWPQKIRNAESCQHYFAFVRP